MTDLALPHKNWDILIPSTSVSSSLLACALSRRNLRVLQLDSNPYYGGPEASFTLPELSAWISSLPSTPNPTSRFTNGAYAEHLPSSRPRAYTLTLAPHIVYWDSQLLELLRDVGMTTSFTWQAAGGWWVHLTDSDVAVPSASSGVGGALVEAGVKVMKAGGTIRKKGGAGWNKTRARSHTISLSEELPASSQQSSGSSTSTRSTTSTLRNLGGVLREVPATFEDVAWSSDLSDRDRGYLGGFLRFVLKSQDATDAKHSELLQQHGDESFQKFLTTVFPLPPFTIASLHSLTTLSTPPDSTPLKLAVFRLSRHLSSLGRIPDIRTSPALTIAYGASSELAQVLSRGVAVAGGVNVLDMSITSLSPPNVALSNGEIVEVGHIILPSSPSSDSPEVKAYKGIYVLTTPLSALFEKKSIDDRVSPAAAMITFPAGSLNGNIHPVYLLAHSSQTGECEPGESVVYSSTLSAGGYGRRAVDKLLGAVDGEGAVKVCATYEQHYFTEDGGSEEEEEGERVLRLRDVGEGLVFEDSVVEECMRVYERIVGTREGFLMPPEGTQTGEEEY
jgi:RAB protein geranylgeranyltransferase component A